MQSTVRLGNLDTTRDFTYVQDTVNGFIKAIQAEGVEGGQFNLGTGAEIRVGELAENIIRKVGRPVTISLDPLRLRPEKSEVLRLISDNRLAREHLGWQPQTSLDDGLDQTIAWISSHIELYKPDVYQF